MAITNAQQFKQLVNPPMKGNKRPGYRGDDAARAASARSNMEGRADPGRAPRGEGPKTGAPSIGMINEIRRQNLEKAPDVKEKPNKFNFLDFVPGIGAVRRIASVFGPLDNREFFQQKVVPAGRTNLNFDDYMKARQAGLIDAYGNPIDQDNDNNNNIIPPQTMMAETMFQAPSNMDQETTTEDDGLKLRFRAEGGPIGGEYDFESARQMYGLGKLVKKVTRTVKKIAKSPIGKAALIGAVGFGIPGTKIGGLFGRAAFGGKATGLFGTQGIAQALQLGKMKAGNLLFGIPGDMGGRVAGTGLLSKIPGGGVTAAIAGTSLLAGLLTPEQEEEAQLLATEQGIDIEAARNSILNAGTSQDFRARGFRAEGGRIGYDEAGAVMSKGEMEKLAKSPEYKGFKIMYGVDPNMAKRNKEYKGAFEKFEQLFKKGYQKGGDVEPVAKKTMPLLDMDGQEMDLRDNGGFVPIGRMEKADDVPARLSKNEFVFTADAVRNAGDGDVDKGAEVMYNMMKNLEAGGDVSKESQGLEGARRMFQTSQRLEEVL